ncbi:acyl-CoA N-acyltransferase [Scleroderma yunnanense]
MPTFIRWATKADGPALSRICLLTADAGDSAETIHAYPELPGLIYALPYINLPSTWAFVLVDKPCENLEHEDVVGYCIGALDTRIFEAAASETWWPPLRVKYGSLLEANQFIEPPLKDADWRYIDTIMNFPLASDAQIRFSPAHLHLNVLPSHQRKGYGRQLIKRVIQHLDEQCTNGIWLGMDPRNKKAAKFYEMLGFHPFEGAPGGVVGITVQEFQDR